MNLKKNINIIMIIITVSMCFLKNAFCKEFYEFDTPKRKIMIKNYIYNIDAVYGSKKKFDNKSIDRVYAQKKQALKNEKNDVKKKEKIDKKLAESKKKKFKLIDLDKKNVKSWLQDWLPSKEKPMNIVGAYTSFKLLAVMPFNLNISANETSGMYGNYSQKQLFTGVAKYFITPAFAIAVGNDKIKWWRWETELGYFPIIARNKGSVSTQDSMSGYKFLLTRKDLSMHLLTMSFNNFLQHAFLDENLVCYVGLGAGVGYAWSMSSKLSSDFVMPIVNGSFGVSFMVAKKTKMNISYMIMYSRFGLPNKYQFNRISPAGKKEGDRAIQSGKLKFNQFLINVFSIELLLY